MVIPASRAAATAAPAGGTREWASSPGGALLDENNNNEHLVLHFPHRPPGMLQALTTTGETIAANNNNEGESLETGEQQQLQSIAQRQSVVSTLGLGVFAFHRSQLNSQFVKHTENSRSRNTASKRIVRGLR